MSLLKYQPEIHHISTEKGFWDQGKNRSKGEMVMFMVSELGECLEAHQKGNSFMLPQDGLEEDWKILTEEVSDEKWTPTFKDHVKDTWQDEIADVVIRILDYCYGWSIPLDVYSYPGKKSSGNFGEDLLRINWHILNAYHGDTGSGHQVRIEGTWDLALHTVICFCKWYAIDIDQHVQWKMRYNATRPQKHGKAY